MVQVWLVELGNSAPCLEAEEARTPRLSADDMDRIAAMADPELQRQRRLSTIALRILVAATVATDHFDRMPFTRSPDGKPGLPGTPLTFSVAHAGGRALIAIDPASQPVGVDLEATRQLRMASDRCRALIRAAEDISSQGMTGNATADEADPIDHARALQAWVRLEALAKADGAGIGRVLTAAGVLGRGRRDAGASQSAGARPWTAPYVAAGLVVSDLVLPVDPQGRAWYAAVAAQAARLGENTPGVRILPGDPSSLRALLAGAPI